MTSRFWIALLLASQAVAAQVSVRFDVPAQPLADAVRQVAEQSNTNIFLDAQIRRRVEDRQSVALNGILTVDEALSRILEGSGIRHQFTNEHTVVLEVAASSPKGVVLKEASATPTASDGKDDDSMSLPESDDEGSELTEIIVTGSHLRSAPLTSPLIAITEDEISRSGYLTTSDVVRNLPQSFGGGLNATAVGAVGSGNPYNAAGASTVNLRGLGSESTLTLVNGRRLAYASDISAVDIGAIPLAAVERIDVLTDGASAIYGSDAVAGVVNFILKQRFDGIEARASHAEASRGGGQMDQYDALAGTSWGNGNALLSYQYSHQDSLLADERSFTTPEVAGTSLLPDDRRHSVFGRVTQQLGSRGKVFAQGLYTQRRTHSSLDLGSFSPGLLVLDNPDVEQYGVSAGGSLNLNQAWVASLTIDAGRNVTSDPQSVVQSGVPLYTVEQSYETTMQQAEAAVSGPLIHLSATRAVSLATGMSYRKEALEETQAIDATRLADIDATRDIKSLYGELSVPLVLSGEGHPGLEMLALSAAGRYERYSDFGSNSISKLGVAYGPLRTLNLRASWGEAFRAPSLLQEHAAQYALQSFTADPLAPSGTSIVIQRLGGNPNLQPEKASTITIGADYLPSWSDDTRLSLTYYRINYRSRIENIANSAVAPLADLALSPFVIRDPTTQQLADVISGSQFLDQTGLPYDPAEISALVDTRYANSVRQKSYGLDALATHKVKFQSAGELELSMNVAYLEAQRRLTTLSPVQHLVGTLFNPPKYRARAGASWNRGGWTASLFLNFTSHFIDPLAVPPERIDSWRTADAQVGYRFEGVEWLKGGRILLSAQNLTDEKPPFLTGALSGNPGLHYDSTNASPVGRFVSLQLLKSWKTD